MDLNITLPVTFYLGIILIFICCKIDMEKCCCLVLISSVFLGVSFVNILGNSIIVYHVCSLVLFIKFFRRKVKCREKFIIKKEKIGSLYFFLIYCFFSIFVVCFRETTLVSAVDPGTELSHFKFQQFTQYMYLFHAFVMMYMIYRLLQDGDITMDKLWKCIDIMYLTVVIIGFIQLFVPVDIFNFFLKNDANGAVRQSAMLGNIKIVRIDSTFPESSMLTVFLVPILAVYIYDISKKVTLKKVLFVICGLLIEILNQSSSFIIGIAAFVAGLFMINIVRIKNDRQTIKVNKKKLSVVLIIVFSVLFVFKDLIMSSLILFYDKVTLQHGSGRARFGTMKGALQVFKDNPLLGLGFGTMRSMDLFSNWLGQLGIVGLLLYLVPVGLLLFRLLLRKEQEGNRFFLLIVIYNAIMFAAVPEFRFLFIWMYYAMAFYYIETTDNKQEHIIKNQT